MYSKKQYQSKPRAKVGKSLIFNPFELYDFEIFMFNVFQAPTPGTLNPFERFG